MKIKGLHLDLKPQIKKLKRLENFFMKEIYFKRLYKNFKIKIYLMKIKF